MNAIELLERDHRSVEELFEQYRASLNDPVGPQRAHRKQQIVREISRQLSIHAAIEEQELYPFVRDVLPNGSELVEEALSEHQHVKDILAGLEDMEPDDTEFDSRVSELVQSVVTHVDEEESQIFPDLREKASDGRLAELAESLESARGMAPTHPHPHAPDSPPGNVIAGPVAAAVDRLRDRVSGD